MLALVFAMQGLGILLAALMAVIAISVVGKFNIEADVANLDYVWRFLAGFGAVPALCAVYFRLTIPESPRYTMEVEGEAAKAAVDADNFMHGSSTSIQTDVAVHGGVNPTKAYLGRFTAYFGIWKNAKILIACSMCWFLLDVGYYGTNLNTSIVLKAIGFADSKHGAYWFVWQTAVGQLIIALCGNVPGYFFTVIFVERWGRKPIQLMGFTMLTICFLVLGVGYDAIKSNSVAAFVVIYSLAQFFFNFGPNSTTFIYPAELFPTAVRSSGHGIAAASGKLGAIVSVSITIDCRSIVHHGR